MASNLLLVAAYCVKRSQVTYHYTLWALAFIACLLRGIQSGLMWRQTGPIIISMSYMLKDILTFLGRGHFFALNLTIKGFPRENREKEE